MLFPLIVGFLRLARGNEPRLGPKFQARDGSPRPSAGSVLRFPIGVESAHQSSYRSRDASGTPFPVGDGHAMHSKLARELSLSEAEPLADMNEGVTYHELQCSEYYIGCQDLCDCIFACRIGSWPCHGVQRLLFVMMCRGW